MTEDTIIFHGTRTAEGGGSVDVVRAIGDSEKNREHIPEDDILTPGDPGWRDEYADMEPNEEIELIE